MGIYTLKVEGEKLSDGPYAVSEEKRIFMKGLTGGLIRHGIKVAGCRIFFEKKRYMTLLTGYSFNSSRIGLFENLS